MRFPKGALTIDGASLLSLQCSALVGVVDEVVVVLGWSSSLVGRGLPRAVRTVRAPRWWRGSQSDSVRAALTGHQPARVLVQPVDVPPPCAELVRALLAEGGSVVPCHAGRRGHPVVLGDEAIERLRRGPLPDGLRGVLGDARELQVDSPAVLANLNDPRQLARWLRDRSR